MAQDTGSLTLTPSGPSLPIESEQSWTSLSKAPKFVMDANLLSRPLPFRAGCRSLCRVSERNQAACWWEEEEQQVTQILLACPCSGREGYVLQENDRQQIPALCNCIFGASQLPSGSLQSHHRRKLSPRLVTELPDSEGRSELGSEAS